MERLTDNDGAATLFRRLPTLKLAVAEEKLEYSGARQNIGLVHLPVQW